MKFIPMWYDQDEVKKIDDPIEADSEEEARNVAYRKYDGHPPYPMLFLKKEYNY